jgi:DNA-binding NarL/FixJ family response regulator
MTAIELGPANHAAWQGILTPRQAEVIELVAMGWTTSQIARELYICEQTVKYHISDVYDRLKINTDRGIHQRVILARWWWTHVERH